jgi:hypothetical protein
LRTGPLVRRGADSMRAAQPRATTPRPSRLYSKQNLLLHSKQDLSLPTFSVPSASSKTGFASGCRLPINLRSFLAEKLGCEADASDDTILEYAASADQFTLNRLARALRRYSTARAREAWVECSVPVTSFVEAHQQGHPVLLCLRCARVDFGDAASNGHQNTGCVPIMLCRKEADQARALNTDNLAAEDVPEQVQHLVEEFRALRSAFGLCHFDLDCYLRGTHLILMWRPLG